jgi:hypothetical protein
MAIKPPAMAVAAVPIGKKQWHIRFFYVDTHQK